MISSLCVYCGSAGEVDPQYRAAASALGAGLAASGIVLVYGGARLGLMGVLADAALSAGGEVIGILPAHLEQAEVAHHGVSELVLVGSMHERKQLMAERADAFAILPGGIGTLDEAFEIITWRQIGLHDKPLFLVDVGGYWQQLLVLLDHIVAERFAAPLIPRLLRVVPDIPQLLSLLTELATVAGGTRSDLA